ncbi:carbon monoxide dehydrogenase [Phyllobacterium brassicacearum]|uniref:Carbon monoxide dehydrogenase n=1 Tax=Phyllobacterium brassicacearum TaxID=314235 RepID=A0A2P7BPL2_9HYPH|nr:xanthine dehydrogenase family protein subunit M [Phyllobacterium brassicacearum]PSH68403.1 carbon monoxide dehydrogenase [Phyllobacterium brassicacearum]TDQ31718.1 carbon-monoxide dehydrogenase medium subunit [Phyllobacterium brassicacearum]
MYETQYHRATSVEGAARLMGEAEDGKYLAGGMTLIPTMKQRLASPSDLIDLRRIEALKGIKIDGRKVRIGAVTTHYDVSVNEELAKICPAITNLASHIGDPQVRNMGTIGGSIANNDPAADYPSAMLALDATIITNQRSVPASAFFTGLFETALEPDEIITAVEFTTPDKAAYKKFPNPASLYAMAGVFVARSGDRVRVAVTGAGENGVYRLKDAETALASSFGPSALDTLSVNPDGLLSDLHATAEYRANLVKVMAKRAVAEIANRPM